MLKINTSFKTEFNINNLSQNPAWPNYQNLSAQIPNYIVQTIFYFGNVDQRRALVSYF